MKKVSKIASYFFVSICMLSTYGTAKEWSLNDEVYACGTSGMTLEELASAGITLISHAPWGGEGKSTEQAKAFLEEAHRYGIKVIPYVSLYKVINSHEIKDTYHTKGHPFFKEVDLVEHPEWALIDENGNIRRPFDSPMYRSGVHQSCTNVAGLAEAYAQGVKNLMEMGFDGVFVDNVHPYPVCYGPKFGKHEHVYLDKDNNYTYHLALKKVYNLVKEYGGDKVVMLNTGTGPKSIYADCDDGTMLESYMCCFVHKNRQNRWNSFAQAMNWAKEYVDYVASGKAVIALSYLDWTSYPLKDDAFYSSACAKISNFVWSGNVWRGSWSSEVEDRPGNDVLRLLYRANLKKPLTEIKEKNGVTYRVFENDLIAVNPGDSSIDVKLPVPEDFTEACDLYSGAILPVSSRQITVCIPPESGRFYVSPDAVFLSYLNECPIAAKGVQQRLDQINNNTDIPLWTVRDSTRLMGQGQVTVDRTQAHSGDACLKITSQGNGQEVWANQAGMMFLQDEAQEYSVSYWAKVESGTGASAKLLFEADFKEGGNGYLSPPEVTETEWTYKEATYVSPKPIRDVEVFCSASYDKPGTVWIDDITVTSAGKSDWSRNAGFEQINETIDISTEKKLRQWLSENLSAIESLSKTYKKIPDQDDCNKLVSELASQQSKLSELINLQSDEIVKQRLENLREYSGRLLAMVTGVTLTIDAPQKAIPGEEITIKLNLQENRADIQKVEYVLEVPDGWEAKPVNQSNYEIIIPQDTPVNFPKTLTALASFDHKNKQNETIRLTLVQTHGLQIADNATQTKHKELTEDEFQKLHADPK